MTSGFKIEVSGFSMTDMNAPRYYVLAVEAASEEEALDKARQETSRYTVWGQGHRVVSPDTHADVVLK